MRVIALLLCPMNQFRNSILFILLVFLSRGAVGQGQNIKLIVQQIEGNQGQLVIGLFDDANSFKAKTNPLKAAKVNITDTTLAFTFSAIPTGNYCVAVFHDENGDGKVNTKSLKIPTEGVGVSGKMYKIRAPKFEDAAFYLQNDTVIVIRMFYPDSR